MCGIEGKETLWGKQIIYDFLQIDPSRLFVKSNKGSKRNGDVHQSEQVKNNEKWKNPDYI